MNSYPAIEDHGLIGDLQTTALVATYACTPAFTTPATPSPEHFSARRPQPSSVGRLHPIGQISPIVPGADTIR
jgi:hypothetical protein